MKKVILFLLGVMPILAAAQTSESNCPRKAGEVVTVSKQGLKTTKDVLGVSVCPDEVTFIISYTNMQAFKKVGGVWNAITSGGDLKEVTVSVEDGKFTFRMTDKKYLKYYINIKKDEI